MTGFIALMGGYRIDSVNWDWNALIRSLFMFLVVGVGEEVLFRGIVFRMIDDRWGTVVALVVSALIFGFVHISNNNATVWSSVAIAVEAGLLLGAAYKWSGTLWVPIGIHWSWNYFQGPVFGFAVSGNGTQSLVDPVIQGSDWLTGGSFGAEASIPAFVLGLALAIVLLLAPVGEAAGGAFGSAGCAGVATVENQPVVGAGAKVLRNMALQVALDLQGRLAVR